MAIPRYDPGRCYYLSPSHKVSNKRKRSQSVPNDAAALFSTISGLIVHKTGRYRECLLAGWAIWAIALGLLSTLDEPSLGKQVGYAVLAGVGLGNTLQPSLIAIQAGVDRSSMATVTSFRNFIRNLGGTLGLAICGTIINNSLHDTLNRFDLSSADLRLLLDSPDRFMQREGAQQAELIRAAMTGAYKSGFRIVFIVGAALNAFAFLAAWFLMPQVELARPDDEKLKEEGLEWEKRKNSKDSDP